jgi:hypothetical protein
MAFRVSDLPEAECCQDALTMSIQQGGGCPRAGRLLTGTRRGTEGESG